MDRKKTCCLAPVIFMLGFSFNMLFVRCLAYVFTLPLEQFHILDSVWLLFMFYLNSFLNNLAFLTAAVHQQCSPKNIQLGHKGIRRVLLLVPRPDNTENSPCYWYCVSCLWRQGQKVPLQERTAGDLITAIKGVPWKAAQIQREGIHPRYGSDASKIEASVHAGIDWN